MAGQHKTTCNIRCRFVHRENLLSMKIVPEFCVNLASWVGSIDRLVLLGNETFHPVLKTLLLFPSTSNISHCHPLHTISLLIFEQKSNISSYSNQKRFFKHALILFLICIVMKIVCNILHPIAIQLKYQIMMTCIRFLFRVPLQRVTCAKFNSIKLQINFWLSISYTIKKKRKKCFEELKHEFWIQTKKRETQTTRNGISYVIVNFNVTIALYVFTIPWIAVKAHTHAHIKVSKQKKVDYVNTHREYVSRIKLVKHWLYSNWWHTECWMKCKRKKENKEKREKKKKIWIKHF